MKLLGDLVGYFLSQLWVKSTVHVVHQHVWGGLSPLKVAPSAGRPASLRFIRSLVTKKFRSRGDPTGRPTVASRRIANIFEVSK